MTTTVKHIHALILTLAFALALATPAIAADGDDLYEDEVAEETDMSADDVTDEDLIAFYEASQKITEIREDHAGEIEGEDGVEARKEAAEAMASAVEDADLSVDEYRGIAHLFHEDEDLRDQLGKALADA